MSEEIKKPEGGEGEGKEVKVEDLQKQIDNLTKGIAGYRDEAAAAKKEALEAKKEAEEAKKAAKKEPEVEIPKDLEAQFKAWAEKNGIATKKELEEEKARTTFETIKSYEQQAVTEFLEKHPEYDKDEEWSKVMEEFNLYKTPNSLAGFRALLDKVHKNLGGGPSKEKARAEARAEISNRSRLSLGGKGGSDAGNGDDEAAIEELQKKYPSLSRDAIEARLAEIRALYPKKK